MADLIKRLERRNSAMYYNRRSPEQRGEEVTQSFSRWYKQEQANTNDPEPKSGRDLPRLSSGLTNSEDLLLLMQEQGHKDKNPHAVNAYNGRYPSTAPIIEQDEQMMFEFTSNHRPMVDAGTWDTKS